MQRTTELIAELYRAANELPKLTEEAKLALLLRASSKIDALQANAKRLDLRINDVAPVLNEMQLLAQNIRMAPDENIAAVLLTAAELIRLLNILNQQ